MEINIEKINEVILELRKFSSNILTLNPPVNPELITQFEKDYCVKLPNDYKYLLSRTNGFNLMGNDILGINYKSNNYDLVKVYRIEHFEVMYPQYKYLIPFCPDGGGSFYCFDLNKKTEDGDSCNIVFWYSNYEYTESDPPEITHSCLADFINECIIGWTLDVYNYDGSNK
jgi:hypothetical protein